ncbi:MAG: bifunctional enoyl-CoA hydratase/phosphate acetyltransferase [Candidatus Marinimicrobia bacterium]|nr:bifunctional enoyl-CoA hydratase/phosphate acetyltransferase [Candidatus Neomarinimicrobiota bacterium]
MIRTFDEIFKAVENLSRKKTISVAMADDFSVLSAIKEVDERGIVNALLVGNAEKIKTIANQIGYAVKTENIINVESDEEVAARAVALVREGKAEILMKGHVSTPILMKAVLNKETGLRKGDVLSHVTIAEVSTYPRLILWTDGGLNIQPDLETKKAILKNAIGVAERLGNPRPNASIICPIEDVNPKIPETIDAAELQKLGETGEFGEAIVEGPMAMDVALSRNAAEKKGLVSKIAGETDIFLVPNLTCGNVMIKALMLLVGAKVGGVIVGAKVPIILLSRSDKPAEKLNSILIAVLLSE